MTKYRMSLFPRFVSVSSWGLGWRSWGWGLGAGGWRLLARNVFAGHWELGVVGVW
jgi:hypothetical protein